MYSYIAFLPVLNAILCISLSVFTLSRNSRHPSNKGFALGLVALALIEAGDAILLLSNGRISVAEKGIRLSITGQAVLPIAWLVFSTTFARIYHKDILLKWVPVIIGMSALALFFIYDLSWGEANDFLILLDIDGNISFPVRVGAVGRYFYIYLILGLVLNLVNLETTFRSSNNIKRGQIKYIILGVGSILAFFIYLASQTLLFSSMNTHYIPSTAAVILLSWIMMAFFMVRHQLLDADIFVSRYVIYNSVTVLVVGLYLLGVGIISQLIRYFEIPFSYFFVTFFVFAAVLMLVILLFSTTARRKLQLFINRHFYKHKYEFRDKWMETTEKISSKSSVKEISDTLIDMIRDTMGASAVELWLYDPASGTYKSAKGNRSATDINHIIRRVERELAPFAMDEGEGDLSDQGHKDGKEEPKPVLCAPLLYGPGIIGFILLGKDISGEPYRLDDFQILTAVTTQAAVQIKNIRLAEELATVKEVEAFHRMSSFIMHDLKNLTNSLSLVSQNAKHHISNPEFQQDAIRTIDSTVSRMKGLIDKFSSMPVKELELKKGGVSVSDLVIKAADKAGVPGNNHVVFGSNVDKDIIFFVDHDAIEMVFLNILKNSLESIHGEGKIIVKAITSDGWIDVIISDNGPGMSREFIEHSLFRPFKSTKKGGIGIGLYQCKSVIEAHGGSITVTSEEGMGTEFTVRLPLNG